MAQKIAAVIRQQGVLVDTRVTFRKVTVCSEDPETGEVVRREGVVATSKDKDHGGYYVERFGTDLNRDWVRNLVAASPECSIIKFC